jgi:hypothetical protein
MAVTAPAHRPSVGARRAGYAIAVAFNVAVLYLVFVWPGWRAVPLLTDDTRRLLGLVAASMVAGILANLVYLAYDPPAVKAIGDLATTGIALVVLVRIWRVFPFDFAGYAFDWALLVRVVLVVAVVGTAIGLLAQLGILVRALNGGAASR